MNNEQRCDRDGAAVLFAYYSFGKYYPIPTLLGRKVCLDRLPEGDLGMSDLYGSLVSLRFQEAGNKPMVEKVVRVGKVPMAYYISLFFLFLVLGDM